MAHISFSIGPGGVQRTFLTFAAVDIVLVELTSSVKETVATSNTGLQ